MDTPGETAEGLVIKAQALAAWMQMPKHFTLFNENTPAWTAAIVGAIHRQAGADAPRAAL